jgi:hypothetical protein
MSKRVKKIKFPEGENKVGFRELYIQREKVQGILEGKLGTIKCGSGNGEVQ